MRSAGTAAAAASARIRASAQANCAGTADAVLSCEVDAPSAYDSLVPAMAVVETVVAGVLAARGDEARARMAACEQVARAADLLD